MFTDWGNCLDCTFKTIEDMPCTGRYYLEALIVVVSANFAFCHGISSSGIRLNVRAAGLPSLPLAGISFLISKTAP
jgi:hypothetical protein